MPNSTPFLSLEALNYCNSLIELTGDTSITDYQTAIAQIEYTNSIGYHGSDRSVEVVVNDGTHASNIATTTIEVISLETYTLSETVYDDTNLPNDNKIEPLDTPIFRSVS